MKTADASTPNPDQPSIPPPPSNDAAEILNYLQHHIPAYPFDPNIDRDFVEELVQDFNHIDILQETKAFRWYYDNQPVTKLRNVRLGLRRWLARTWTSRQNP